ILVDHQLGFQGISWEEFISHDFFSAPPVVSKEEHKVGGPSHQFERHEAATVLVYISYQRGNRPLFASTNQVLSPARVEGASLPTSAPQKQSKGKEPVHDEGPSGEP
ncbi:Hypothetical predicted protein, partial [Olea europaea subsp. europaea]